MDLPLRKTLPHAIPLWIDPQREIYFITINCRVRGMNQLATQKIAIPLFETIRHRQTQALWWPHIFLLMPDHIHALISFPNQVRTAEPAVHFPTLGTARRAVRFPLLGTPGSGIRQKGGHHQAGMLESSVREIGGHLRKMSLPTNQVGTAGSAVRASQTLHGIVTEWKRWTARKLGIDWQRDFFEHRLRHEESRREKADYILQNPVRKNLVSHAEDWPFVYFAEGQRPQFKT